MRHRALHGSLLALLLLGCGHKPPYEGKNVAELQR